MLITGKYPDLLWREMVDRARETAARLHGPKADILTARSRWGISVEVYVGDLLVAEFEVEAQEEAQ